MLSALPFIIVAYFLGAVPWGLVIAKVFCGIDPRKAGSCNTGATNVSRLCGFGWGVATLACDLLKGTLPVLLAICDDRSVVGITLVAFAAVLGHVFSCFMGFKGGKAVATSIGVFIPLSFPSVFVAAIVCLVAIWRSGFVSLGSLCLVGSLPIWLCVFKDPQWLVLSLCVLALVVWRHKENIVRLRNGTEKSWLKSRQKSS